jgi:hypothetical protein
VDARCSARWCRGTASGIQELTRRRASRFDHDVLIEGKPLRAGEYSLWLIPRASAPWTVIFSRAAHVFHKPYPGNASDVLRVDVSPAEASSVESFTIYFPKVLRDEAELWLHWGTTAVPIRIKAPFQPH